LCPYLCVSGSEGFWLGGGFLALVSLSLLVGLLSSLGIMGCCILCCVVWCGVILQALLETPLVQR
jgi:hypothetical protein